MKKILDIKNVTLKYGDKYAIKDINLSIFSGDIVALVGHNGAGKSSLFNIIAGIQEPTTGTIEYNQSFIESRLFSTIGFSPQSQVMDWYTNVWDNVFLGSQLAGINSKEGKELTKQALHLLNISDLKNKEVDALSGGQQQRVQIARAIVHKPDFYLLDEPTTGLDAETSNQLLSYLKSEALSGKAVFVSSHDLNLLEEYCNRLVLIDKGSILYSGDLHEFLSANSPKKSYKIEINKELDLEMMQNLNNTGIFITKIAPYNYNIILNSDNELTKFFQETEDKFKVLDITKNSLSLRDLYIHYRERGDFEQ